MSAIPWCNTRRQIGPSLLFFLITLLLAVATLGQTQQPIFPTTQVTVPSGVVLVLGRRVILMGTVSRMWRMSRFLPLLRRDHPRLP